MRPIRVRLRPGLKSGHAKRSKSIDSLVSESMSQGYCKYPFDRVSQFWFDSGTFNGFLSDCRHVDASDTRRIIPFGLAVLILSGAPSALYVKAFAMEPPLPGIVIKRRPDPHVDQCAAAVSVNLLRGLTVLPWAAFALLARPPCFGLSVRSILP